MWTICDTNAMLFWADRRQRLTTAARTAIEDGLSAHQLACADISLWEITLLFRKGRLILPAGHSPAQYLDDIV